MYRVRGADQNIYGPIDAETVRQWIRERRLNGESQICRDGEETWQSLGQLSEFSADLTAASVPVVPSMPSATPGSSGSQGGAGAPGFAPSREAVLAQVKPAAICMIVYGALSLLLSLWSVVSKFIWPQGQGTPELPPNTPEWVRSIVQAQTNMPAAAQWALILLSVVMSGVILQGGLKFLKLESRGLVLASAIIAILSCCTSCCCGLGIPLGIWTLTLINKSEIQSEFR